MSASARCVCDRMVQLRTSGARSGAFYKHRDMRGGWCGAGGEYPAEVAKHPTSPIREAAATLAENLFGPVDTESMNTFSPATAAFLGAVDNQNEQRAALLGDWWLRQAQSEIAMVVVKAIEYGATDLRDLGRQILEMAGRPVVSDDEATEVGIVFYAQGKLARAVAAVKEGRRPSYDTWLDLGVYARMAQRVHSHGGWPAV